MPVVTYKQPFNTIVLDFPKTLKPETTKEKILIPFFHQYLPAYIRDNMQTSADLIDVIRQMRIESETSSKQYPDCPVVAPKTAEPDSLIKTVTDYVKWSQKNKRSVTRSIERLRSLVWAAGYKKGLVPSDIFPDVPKALDYWASYNIKIFTYATMTIREQKTILNTNKQLKLAKYIKFFMEKEKIGEKDSTASYVLIARLARTENENVLFVTDYAVYAKAALDAGLHVAVIDRNKKFKPPKNTEFVYIQTLTDITFAAPSLSQTTSSAPSAIPSYYSKT